MTEERTDYSQIYDFLYRIEKRINYLESDALFIEKKITVLNEKKSTDFSVMSKDLSDLHLNIVFLKNNFTQCAHEMARLSKNLKDTIKKDDIQNLNTQLDEIKFEEYVTAKDLDRGV